MKAWLLDKAGDGIDKLHLADVPDPTPRQGQVVVNLHYAGLNPADRYLAENQYPARPTFPHILGRDGVGVVSALGPNVTTLKVGQKVNIVYGEAGINQRGTFAGKLLAPIETLGDIPRGWTDEQAAAAPLVYITAYQAISQWDDLPRSGGTVLITGASGGVGVASIHVAKALGHTVIGLSRSSEKAQKLREIGADLTFDPTDADWKKAFKDQLGKKRVDLAIDNIGGPLFNDLIEVMGNHGRVSVVGRLAGPVPDFNTATLFFRRLRIGGVAVHAYTVAEARSAWGEVLSLLNRTGAKPLIDSVHPFENLKDAFAQLARGPMGKVLIRVKP